jgi:hypothetical protein
MTPQLLCGTYLQLHQSYMNCLSTVGGQSSVASCTVFEGTGNFCRSWSYRTKSPLAGSRTRCSRSRPLVRGDEVPNSPLSNYAMHASPFKTHANLSNGRKSKYATCLICVLVCPVVARALVTFGSCLRTTTSRTDSMPKGYRQCI